MALTEEQGGLQGMAEIVAMVEEPGLARAACGELSSLQQHCLAALRRAFSRSLGRGVLNLQSRLRQAGSSTMRGEGLGGSRVPERACILILNRRSTSLDRTP